MAWASTVAVVVPSPAMSEVFEATSRTICAPMFSCGSFSSISLATVTPSLVMVGEPNFFSITTLRPLGPRVTLTASARRFTPRRIACRDSSPCTICLAIISILLVEFESLFSLTFVHLRVLCGYCSFRTRHTRKLATRAGGFLFLLAGRTNHNAEDLFLAHDDEILTIQLDLRSG